LINHIQLDSSKSPLWTINHRL